MIERDILLELKQGLDNNKTTIVLGSPRVGKTTLLDMISGYIKNKSIGNYVYIDFKIYRNDYSKFLVDLDNNTKKLKLEKSNKIYLLLDNFNLNNLENKLNFDNIFYKCIITRGLFDVENTNNIEVLKLYTLSFLEFAKYKTHYQYPKMNNFFDMYPILAFDIFNEYLRFGGYPEVVLEETIEAKVKALKDIYIQSIEKSKFKNISGLVDFLTYIANKVGRNVNTGFFTIVSVFKAQDIIDYSTYLQKIGIIKELSDFKNEYHPIYYFTDLGLRNYILNENSIEKLDDDHYIFSNFVFIIILHIFSNYKEVISIKYLRGYQRVRSEIIVIREDGHVIIRPTIWNRLDHINDTIVSYMSDSRFRNLFIVTIAGYDDLFYEDKKISRIPYYELFYLNLFLNDQNTPRQHSK